MDKFAKLWHSFFCSIAIGEKSINAPESLTHVWFEDEGDLNAWVITGEIHFQICATGFSNQDYCWNGDSYEPGTIYSLTLVLLDTDEDGIPDDTDWDDDNDGAPDQVDAEPLNNANSIEIDLPLDAYYKGMNVKHLEGSQP